MDKSERNEVSKGLPIWSSIYGNLKRSCPQQVDQWLKAFHNSVHRRKSDEKRRRKHEQKDLDSELET